MTLSGDSTNGIATLNGKTKQPLKILMLHGFTQSGPLFHSKTKALEKFLIKALASENLAPSLIYPSAPNRLHPSDVPGFDSSSSTPTANPDDGPDMRAWFRKDEGSNTYRLLDEGMAAIAHAISAAGGIHGICGFSQGGAMTALVASALEPQRRVPEGAEGGWARKLRAANGGRAALFAVSYSGFMATPLALRWLFEPKIETPTLHYIGSLDTVVEEGRSRALIDVCEDPVVVVHPGGHFVPIARDWATPLAGFIKNYAGQAGNKL